MKVCQIKPLDESSSIGCLNAVISLKVQRKRTTLSCSFRMGAIFTKNHTGIPAISAKKKILVYRYDKHELFRIIANCKLTVLLVHE